MDYGQINKLTNKQMILAIFTKSIEFNTMDYETGMFCLSILIQNKFVIKMQPRDQGWLSVCTLLFEIQFPELLLQ